MADSGEELDLARRVSVLSRRLRLVAKVAKEQAKDESLWFHASTSPEAYLQRALRRLHAAIEGDRVLVAKLDPED